MSDDAPKTLKHAADRYGGVIVDPACLPDDIEIFADSLHASVVAWKEQGVRGVWLQIPITQAHLVGAAAKHEFEFPPRREDARDDDVVVTGRFGGEPLTAERFPPGWHRGVRGERRG
jgi:hypothetical protein